MRKFYTLILISFTSFFLNDICAQQLTLSGPDNHNLSSTYGPMTTNTGVRSNRHAYIYSQPLLASIPSGASITALAFERGTSATATVPAGASFKIYLQNTTVDNFGTADLPWTTAISGATLVFDGDPSSIIGASSGWKEFSLSAPFTYTGDNLAVYVEYIQPAGPSAGINWIYNTSSGTPDYYVSNQTKYSSNTTTTPPDVLTSENERHPNLRINYGTPCQGPANLTSSNNTSSATFSWSAPSGGNPVTEYQYEFRTSGTPGSGNDGLVNSGTTTSTSVTYNNLDPNTRYVFFVRSACTGNEFSGYASTEISTRANDNCSGAIPLSVANNNICATPVAGSTSGTTASNETAPTCSASGANDDVWYSFVANQTSHTVSITNATSATAAAVYSGSCGSLTQISCGTSNTVAGGLTAGQTYYVRVYTTSTSPDVYSDFEICIGVAPTNDECTSPISLSASTTTNCTSTPGSTVGATASNETSPTCNATGTNDDVWYSFVATTTKHIVRLSNTSTASAAAIYRGDCGSLTQLGCGSTLANASGLTVGEIYYVRVYSTSSAAATGATFEICIISPVDNDDCSGAVSLPVTASASCSTPTSGSTENSTQSADAAPSCSATGINDDVWYSFVATQTSHNIFLTNASSTTAAAVYSGTCGGLTEVANACTSDGFTMARGLTPGITYYVRVYTTSTINTTFSTFNICVTTPPANDECAGAFTLTPSSTTTCTNPVSGSTVGATPSTETAPSCSGTGANDDVWYKFVATATSHTALLTNTTGTTAAAIYSGSCGTLTQISGACGTNGGPATGLTPSETYYVRVYSTSTTSGAFSDFTICIISAPSNDDCGGAIALPTSSSTNSCNNSIAGSTIGSTPSTDAAPSCSSSGANDDVWYSFVASGTSHTVFISNASSTTGAAVYRGNCGSLTEIACGSGSPYVSGLTPGVTYYVRVYTTSTSVGTYSNFNICIISPPANDECTNAQSLPVSSSSTCSNPVSGSTLGATPSSQAAPSCSGTGANDDVWYSFVATATSHAVLLYNTSSTSAAAIYSGSCAGLTELACASNTAVATGLTVFDTYYVRVYSTSTVVGTYSTFGICIVVPATNDDCTNAISLPVSSTYSPTFGTTVGATTSSETATTCSATGTGDDVWYSFVATETSHVVTLIEPSTTTAAAVYSGTCGNLTLVTCANTEVSASGLTVGETYYVRVYTTSTSSTTFGTFGINISSLPSNDECNNAMNLVVNGGSVTGTTSGATQSMAGCTGTANDDVWYKFTSPASTATVTVNSSSGFDAVLQVLDACNGNSLACVDGPGDGGSESAGLTNLSPGVTYFIRVYEFASSVPGTPNFDIQVSTPPVAPGTPNTCENGTSPTIDNTNNNQWIAITDASGRLIAEINPNGNNLGTITSRFYKHVGPVRTDPKGRYYLDRNVEITPANPITTGNVTIRFYITAAELAALQAQAGSNVTTINDVSVFKNDDPCGSAVIATAIKLPTTHGTYGVDYVLIVNVSSFSSFYFASNAYAALPIDLVTFTGQRNGNVNVLRWTTASEQNNRGFEVERSTNGIDFTSIGFVNTLAQNGNSSSNLNYTFVDNNISGDKQYYRLKQMELSGSSKISKTVVIRGISPAVLTLASIFPNPANNKINVLIEAPIKNDVLLTITDIAGKVIKTQKETVDNGSNTFEIDLHSLSKGSYLLKLSCQSCEPSSLKFVKQ